MQYTWYWLPSSCFSILRPELTKPFLKIFTSRGFSLSECWAPHPSISNTSSSILAATPQLQDATLWLHLRKNAWKAIGRILCLTSVYSPTPKLSNDLKCSKAWDNTSVCHEICNYTFVSIFFKNKSSLCAMLIDVSNFHSSFLQLLVFLIKFIVSFSLTFI